MSWTLKGSYAETCSCELMCPCNLSFDHGATYDFCRATGGSDLTMAEATRSRIDAFGIVYEGKTGLSTSEFSWAA
jgi:hypothetical protein